MKKKHIKNIVIYTLIAVFAAVAAYEFLFSDKTQQTTAAPLDTVGTEDDIVLEGVYAGLPLHVAQVMQRSIEPPNKSPIVGVGRGTDYDSVTEEAILNAGGLADVIEEGDVVLIKPNLCINAVPDSPITTDYRVVKKVVEMVKALGASKVIIAEGGFMGKNFDEASLERNLYDQIEGVEFINTNDTDEDGCYSLMTQNSILGAHLFIPKAYMDADKVITIAKLKTHFQPEAVVTLSVKNCYGAISSRLYGTSNKIGLHNMGFLETVIEINKIRRPDFAVIDGIVGGEGYGPIYNTRVESGIIFAGRDIAALDTVALTFMGFAVQDVPHIVAAGENNVGITDIAQIEVVGADIDAIKMAFTR